MKIRFQFKVERNDNTGYKKLRAVSNSQTQHFNSVQQVNLKGRCCIK